MVVVVVRMKEKVKAKTACHKFRNQYCRLTSLVQKNGKYVDPL
jgi:hypothetical protein